MNLLAWDGLDSVVATENSSLSLAIFQRKDGSVLLHFVAVYHIAWDQLKERWLRLYYLKRGV